MNEGGAPVPNPNYPRFGFFGRLVGNDIIYRKLLDIERLVNDPEALAILQTALATLRKADTTIDAIEPTQGVPQ